LNKRTLLKAGIGVAVLGSYAHFIEPRWQRVKKVKVTLPNLHPAFNKYRIAQISDIHADDHMTRGLLLGAVTRILKRKPDMVVITGDLMTRRVITDFEALRIALSRLQAPDGVYFVPGNHDYWEDGLLDQLRAMLASIGIVDLSNRVQTITREGKLGTGQLHIAGVDDVVFRQARLDVVLDALPAEGAAILLCHEPDFADVVAPYNRFDLQLSGHTHGGQIRLPFYGTVYGPKHGIRYSAGMYEVDTLKLYVNVGLGTVTLPIRFNCRPEITLFTLRSP